MTTTPIVRKSTDDRQAEVAAAFDQVSEAVAKIQSSEDWKAYLRFGARFHRYSFNNVILMWVQAAERNMAPLSHIAGFRTWLKLNRGVRKGETGLRIFAPVVVKIKEGEKGFPGSKLVGFRLTSVFDLQQTDGEPIPAPPVFEHPQGEAPEGLHEALVAYAAEQGFTVSDGDSGRAEGYTDPRSRKIVVSEKLAGGQRTAVLIHEVAHMLLHMAEDYDYQGHRGVAETEAESTAYVVATYFGMDMRDSSFGYVAGWAPDAETTMKVGQRVMATAKKIIDATEGEVR